MTIMALHDEINGKLLRKHVDGVAPLRACGFHPGPVAYCEPPATNEDVPYFMNMVVFRGLVDVVTLLLVVD